MKNITLSITFLLISLSQVFAQSNEQLIIFIGEDKISQSFKQHVLDSIKSFSKRTNIELKLVSIKNGVPDEVTFVPSIFYQNHLGRSRYSGRYSTLKRLFNFVRTVKNSPRRSSENIKNNIPIFNQFRGTVATPIKVTNIEGGSITNEINQGAFIIESEKSIYRGLSHSVFQKEVNLPEDTRLFYTNYYPYLAEDSTLFISTAVYSMFSCVSPVYKSKKPISGHWNNRDYLFKKAAKLQEETVMQEFKNSLNGDGISFVKNDIPIKSWENLGLSIPQKRDIQNNKKLNIINFPMIWEYSGPLPDNSPIIQFSFGAPIDHYSGEVKDIEMKLKMLQDSSLLGATGYFIVNTQSITMGDQGLDDHIFNEYLKVSSFPNATFNFVVVDAPRIWEPNTIQKVVLEGTFEMIGKPIKMISTASIEIIMNEKSELYLKLNSNFKLPLKKLFGIDGPDGPSPAKDELDFYLNFFIKPSTQPLNFKSDLFKTNKQSISKDQTNPIKNILLG